MSSPQPTEIRHDFGRRVEAWARYFRHLDDLERLKAQNSDAVSALEADLKKVAEDLREKWWSNPNLVWSHLHRIEVEIARAARGDLLLDYAVLARAHLYDPDMKKQDGFLNRGFRPSRYGGESRPANRNRRAVRRQAGRLRVGTRPRGFRPEARGR